MYYQLGPLHESTSLILITLWLQKLDFNWRDNFHYINQKIILWKYKQTLRNFTRFD